MKKERYEYSNIIGIYVNLDDLCKSVTEQIALVNKQLQTFSFFDQKQKSTKDLSKQSAEFLWFQLFNYVIARLPRNEQAKQEMIQKSKQNYRGNTKELRLIDQFEREYRSEETIRWYSKESFVYKLVNKALRTEDIDLLHTFRFFISDLSQSLTNEHEKMLLSADEMLTVYRGAKLDKEEFDKLKENQEKLISTNGYLSTSRVRAKALAFARKTTKRSDVISVLFQIDCDIKQINKSVIFADIAHSSYYPGEEEVLFDLNACFKRESIEQNGSVEIIKMNLSNEGEIITKDYIKLTQQETEEKSISIVFGRLMCNLGEYDKSQKYFEQLLNDPHDEDVAWIEFNIGRALYLKGERKEAREYYDRAYNRMTNNEPPRIKDSASVLNNIGNILKNQGNYDEALDYYQRSLKIREKFYSDGHVNIAVSLSSIGGALDNQAKYDEALDYHQRALKMKGKSYSSDHVHIASSLNNIDNILPDKGKCDEALDYYQRALKMHEKYHSHGHVSIARSFVRIGLIFSDQGHYDEALDHHQRALKIQEKFYTAGHVEIGRSLDNIGFCYNNQNKSKMALDCYQRALVIYEKFLPTEHPNRVRIERSIRRLTGKK